MINKKIRALFGGSQRTSLFTVIKYFFYKKTGNIKLSEWTLKYSHIFQNTIGSGAIVPCETGSPNMVGKMLGSQKGFNFAKWPWKMVQPNKQRVPDHVFTWWWYRVKITEVYKSNKVRYKEQWLKKNAFNPRIKDFNSKWYKVQRQSRKRGKAKS